MNRNLIEVNSAAKQNCTERDNKGTMIHENCQVIELAAGAVSAKAQEQREAKYSEINVRGSTADRLMSLFKYDK